MTRYLIVVARTEPAVYEHLRNRHRDDPKVRVVLDRRGATDPEASEGPPPVDRRSRRSSIVTGEKYELVDVGTTTEAPVPGPPSRVPQEEASRPMNQTEILDDVQRVTQWLADSQPLLGRVFPSLIEDRERLRRALEAREQECERLGAEMGELRRALGVIQSELEALHAQRIAVAEAFGDVRDLLGQLQRPLGDIARRLKIAQPVALGAADRNQTDSPAA